MVEVAVVIVEQPKEVVDVPWIRADDERVFRT